MLDNSATVNKTSQNINITSDKVDLQLNIPINEKANEINNGLLHFLIHIGTSYNKKIAHIKAKNKQFS